MSAPVPSCHALFLSLGSVDERDVFVADQRSSDAGDVVVAVLVLVVLVGNVAVLRSVCHDESECGCLTSDKNFWRFRDELQVSAAGENVFDADDGRSNESGGAAHGSACEGLVEVMLLCHVVDCHDDSESGYLCRDQCFSVSDEKTSTTTPSPHQLGLRASEKGIKATRMT